MIKDGPTLSLDPKFIPDENRPLDGGGGNPVVSCGADDVNESTVGEREPNPLEKGDGGKPDEEGGGGKPEDTGGGGRPEETGGGGKPDDSGGGGKPVDSGGGGKPPGGGGKPDE